MITKEQIQSMILSHVKANGGKVLDEATSWDIWTALDRTIHELVAEDWAKTRETYNQNRQQHYFSAEFLVGRSTLNNLINLNIYDVVKEALDEIGVDINDVLEEETDAALGNGGLGRLAACFMDSTATLNLPVTGYGLLYRYGLFRQKIQNGYQVEYPDSWMEDGYFNMIERDDLKVKVHFDDMDVYAVPHDLPITGYKTSNINTLRLWKAEPLEEFDYNLFNSQRFDDAVRERNRVDDIWRVLYPNDTTYDGKVLRVRQQYFFVSASLQDLLRRHKVAHDGNILSFAEYNSIQLNDTHPVLAVPELVRLLQAEGLTFEKSWEICQKAFAYTNHTILAEALEKWDISIFEYLFPDIMRIIEKISHCFITEMRQRNADQGLIDYLSPIRDGQVHMAWIACYAAYSINGVAQLHTDILMSDTLHDWYNLYPEKFSNKTNGVTPRRWLRNCNPELSELITDLLGDDSWVKDLDQLKQLEKYQDDANVLERFAEVKFARKKALADFIYKNQGIEINPEAQFYVMIKRLHEYKRQLLDAFYVLDLYYRIKENPEGDWNPAVFIFGAKSAPGYVRAKTIIKFINEIANLVNNDPVVNDIIKVVFIENYNVSKAEMLFPAADVSLQISTAGKEASGTGNMKFMMNGAVTLGTLDGANIEIANRVGEDNIYIFGATVDQIQESYSSYNPYEPYHGVPGLQRVVDSLVNGTFNDDNTGIFQDLYNSLMKGSSWEKPDVFYVLGDFASYRERKDQVARDYQDKLNWNKKCWLNICNSGFFSSDRTINDYAEEIWHVKAQPIE